MITPTSEHAAATVYGIRYEPAESYSQPINSGPPAVPTIGDQL